MVISFRFNLLSFFFQPRDYIPNCIDSKLKFQVDTIRSKYLTFHYYYEYYEYYFRYLSNFLVRRRVFLSKKKKEKMKKDEKEKSHNLLTPVQRIIVPISRYAAPPSIHFRRSQLRGESPRRVRDENPLKEA